MKIRAQVLCVVLMALCLCGVFAADAFFTSNFSIPDGSRPQSLTFDTSDDAYWTIRNGWLDTGNGSDLITADGYSFATIESPASDAWNDYTVSCSFYMAQPRGQVVLAGRWIDRANHYQAVVEVYEGRRFLKIVKLFRGRTTDLKVEPIGLQDLGVSTIENGTPATALTLSLSFVGSQISADLGGRVHVAAQDYDIPAGKAAIGERYSQVLFRSVSANPYSAKPSASGSQIAGSASGKAYTVQLNEYRDVADARNLAAQLRLQGYYPSIDQRGGNYSVTLGQFGSQEEANKMLLQMLSEQFLFAKVIENKAPAASTPKVSPLAPQANQALLADVPQELRKSINWKELSGSDQRKVLEAVRDEEAMRSKMQSVTEIMDLKKRVEALNEKQSQMLNTLQQTEDTDKKRILDINQIVTQINRSIEGQDMSRANELVDKLEKLDPVNPLVVLKRKEIEHRKNNTWEGYEQQKENLKKEIASLQSEAATRESSNRFKEAQQLWITIYSKDPLSAEAQKVKQEIDRLGKKVLDQDVATQAEQEKKYNLKLYASMGGAAVLLILAVLSLIMMVRRRHAQILLQMEERAIAPLQELRERTFVLAAAGGSGGNLAFDSAPANLLGQTDTHDAEFVIPEMETRNRSQETAPQTTTLEADDFGPSFDETETVAPARPKMGSMPRVEKSPAPKPAAVSAPRSASGSASGGGDDFIMDFGDEEEQKKDKRVSTLPRSPSTPPPNEGKEDEIVFSFDDMQALAKSQEGPDTNSPVTATEIPTLKGNTSNDEIVFSFDDAITQTKQKEPSMGSAPKALSPDDSIFESISLDDLNLDLTGTQTGSGSKTKMDGGATEALSPLTGDLNLNFDLKIDMPEDTVTGGITTTAPPAADPKESSIPGFDFSDLLSDETTPIPTGAKSAVAANGILYQQTYDANALGSIPSGWTGEKSDYASLGVLDDPDGGGGKCLQFRKTRGDGPTSFSCRFPDVSGNIAVEFDMRCDDKNKHLLGFYVEKDSDFRRSVHTVVQCIDPDRPAYLRIFTKPTPYTLGSWRHVKYIIDLPNGIVDGYVDNKLVAEGVRMGTKTESLNTFSIRDNTESTGVLMLNNLVIYRAPNA